MAIFQNDVFLKDSMVGRKMSGNLTAAKIGEISLQNVSKSPSPALLQTSAMKAGEILPGEGFSKDFCSLLPTTTETN